MDPDGNVRVIHKLPIDPDGNVRVIQQGDISVTGISDGLERIAYAKFERDQLQDGDVLLRSKGSPIVAAQFREKSNMPTIAAAAVLVLRPKATRITPRYLVWLLNSRWAEEIFSTIKSGTYTPVIAVRDLEKVKVPLPALAEQQRICDLSDLARRHEELAGQYRQKIESLLVATSLSSATADLNGGLKNVDRYR
jgi:restriction endonuclease S subunit